MADKPQQPQRPQQRPSPSRASGSGDASRPKILRIGVILGERIVEDRLVRERAPVSIGQSARNTIAIPTTELPATWPLFQVSGGRYVLNFADSMDGRLSEGNQVMTLADVKASGRARRSGSAWQIVLSDQARGKITVGDMTLLFQFVVAPPLQARPQLPHSVRGSITDRIDPYLAVVLSLSLLFHGGLFGYFKFFYEEERPTPPDVIPDQFARVILERPKLPKPEEKPGTQAEEAKPDESKEAKTEKKRPEKVAEAPSAEDIQRKVQNAAPIRVLNQLAFKSGSGRGTVIDTGGKETWDDLGKGLSKVGKGDVIASVGEPGTTRGPQEAGAAVGTRTGVQGPTGPAATGGAKREEEVKVAGKVEPIEDIESGGLDPTKVSAIIKRSYYPRVEQCYIHALKTNPTLGGKVTVNFTIGPAGNVIKASAEGFDSGVDACITSEARRWRFEKPAEGQATFEISFILRPGR